MVGWRMRGVTNVPTFNPATAPSLPAFTVQGVVTNAASGGAGSFLSAPDPAANFTLGLPTTLPASVWARIRELARGLDHDWWKCYPPPSRIPSAPPSPSRTAR